MTEDLVKNLSAYIKYLETNRPDVLKHPGFPQYISDLERYIQMPGVESRVNFWPCLDDRTTETPMDKYYFYQDTWAAKKVFEIRPAAVVDVGSTALLAGIMSQFVPTISIDVRPLPVKLQGLDCKQGSITDLPFMDESVELLTSMCVIEHIGLARYGDALDHLGSIKAFKEATRVIRPGGHFIFSVPLSLTPGLLFNAHRIFSKPQVFGLIGNSFSLHDELFLFPEPGMESQVTDLKDFQYCVWCAHFVKKEPTIISFNGTSPSMPRLDLD
jgi:SAM-dependent methyltransferase